MTDIVIKNLGLYSAIIARSLPIKYKKIFEYLIHLFPLIAITLVIGHHRTVFVGLNVGQKSLFDLMLAVAMCSPWLAHATCMPLYVELGQEMYINGNTHLKTLLCSLVRKNVLTVLLLLGIVSFIVNLIADNDYIFTAFFFLSCFLQIMFSQFMVLPLSLKRFDIWFVSWLTYIASLYFLPELWLLPPILASLVIYILAPWPNEKKTFTTSSKNYSFWLICGLLVGMILWIDKLIMFLNNDSSIVPLHYFLPLIPSLLVLNFYYIYRLPRLEKKLSNTISSINGKSISHYLRWKKITYYFAKQIFYEVIVLLITLSALLTVAAHYFFELEWQTYIISQLITFYMTLITIILNTLLLLRVFKLFFVLTGTLYLSLILFIALRSDHSPISFQFAIMTTLIVLVFIFFARIKWKNPHLSYFSS